MSNNIKINLDFVADTSAAKSNIESLQKSLAALAGGNINKSLFGKLDTESIREASIAAQELKIHLKNATETDTGKLNLVAFNNSLTSAGHNVASLTSALTAAGSTGAQSFLQLGTAIAQANTKATLMGNALTTFHAMAKTLFNTLSSRVIGGAWDTITSQINSAIGYVKKLDTSLNKIRIVTGLSSDEMDRFAKSANEAAKSLNTSTTAYTDAALIYYQQGLRSDEEIQGRTDTTIKMANVTGQSAATVSEQLTAIWNNFYDGSQSLEYYADVITALGANTASSSAEIAQGLGKFAAIAETTGLSYEYATSALATLVSATRQSADTVGTSLKTLFSRLQGLSLGETLEDGVDLNKYSKALNAVGVSVLDSNGKLREMDRILDDLAEKWGEIDNAQQMALAQTVAGVRQYNVLISLMNNWDKMQNNIGIASDASGTLQEQADIFSDAWTASTKRLRAQMEELYDVIMNKDLFIGWNNSLTDIAEIFTNIVKGADGAKGIITAIGVTLLSLFPQFGNFFDKIGMKVQNLFVDMNHLKQTMLTDIGGAISKSLSIQFGSDSLKGFQSGLTQSYTSLIDLQTRYTEVADKMNPIQRATVDLLMEQQKVLIENAEAMARNVVEKEREVETTKNSALGEIAMNSEYQYNKEYNKADRELRKEGWKEEDIYYLDKMRGDDIEQKVLNESIQQRMELVSQLNEKFVELGQRAKEIGVVSEKMRDMSSSLEVFKTQGADIENVKKELISFVEGLGGAEDIEKNFGEVGKRAFDALQAEIADSGTDIVKLQAKFNDFYSITSNGTGINSPLQTFKDDVVAMAKEAGLTAPQITAIETAMNGVANASYKAGAQAEAFTMQQQKIQEHAEAVKQSLNTMSASIGTVFQTALQNIGSTLMAVQQLKSAFKSFDNGDLIAGLISLSMALTAVYVASKKGIEVVAQQIAAHIGEDAVRKILIKRLKAETVAKLSAAEANKAYINSFGVWTLVLTAIITIITGVIAHIKKLKEAEEEARQAKIDDAKSTVEVAKSHSELLDTYEEEVNEYKQLRAEYEKGEATWEQVISARETLQKASEEVCEAYNIEGSAIAELTGDYDKLTESIREAREEEIKRQVETIQHGKDIVETNLTQIANKSELGHGISGIGKSDRSNMEDLNSILQETELGSVGTFYDEGDMGGLIERTEYRLNYDLSTAEGVVDTYQKVYTTLNKLREAGYDQNNSELYSYLETFIKDLQTEYNNYSELNGTIEDLQIQQIVLANNLEDRMRQVQSNNDIDAFEELRNYLINEYSKLQNIDINSLTEEQRTAFLEPIEKYFKTNGLTIERVINAIEETEEVLSKDTISKDFQNTDDSPLSAESLGRMLFGSDWEGSQADYEKLFKYIDYIDKGLNLEQIQGIIERENLASKTSLSSEKAKGAADLYDQLFDAPGTTKSKLLTDDQKVAALNEGGDSSMATWLEQKEIDVSTFLMLSVENQKKLWNEYSIEIHQIYNETLEEEKQAAEEFIKQSHEAGEQLAYIETSKSFVEDLIKRKEQYKDVDMSQRGEWLTYIAQLLSQDYSVLGFDTDTIIKMILNSSDDSLAGMLEYYSQQQAEQEAIYENLLSIAKEYEDKIAAGYYTPESMYREPTEAEWIETFKEKVESEDLKYDDVKDYAGYLMDIAETTDQIDDGLAKNGRAAAQLAERFSRLNNGVKDLNDHFANWKKTLEETDKTTPDYIEGLRIMQDAMGDLLDIDGKQLSDAFYTSAENLELMEKAATGDAEAIDKLRVLAADDIVQQAIVKIDDEDLKKAILDTQSIIDDFINTNELVIGASLDNTDLLNSLEEIINAAGMTAEQASNYLASMGVDADVVAVEDNGSAERSITVPKIISGLEGYPEYDGAETIKYTDYYTGRVGTTLQVKNATWGGKSGGAINRTTKKSGSGGGSKKSKEHKTKEGGDRYHTINEQIQDTTDAISKLKNAEDRAFGVSKVQIMTSALADLAKQADNYGKKLKEATDYYAEDYAAAQKAANEVGMTLQFGSKGEILNWDAVQDAYLDWYNKQVDSYNSGGITDEAFTEAERKFSKAMDAFKQVEETNNLMQELRQNIIEAQQAYEDMLLAIQKEKLEVRIDIDDMGLDLLSYYLEKLNDDLYDGVARMQNYEDQMGLLIDQADAYKDHINDLLGTLGEWTENGVFKSYGLSLEDMPSLLEMSPDDLLVKFGGQGSNVAEIIDQLKDDYNELISTNQALIKQRENMIGEIGKTFDAWNKEIDESEDKLEKNEKLMEHYRNIIDIVGRKTLGITSAFIRDYNSKQLDNDLAELRSSKSQLEMQKAAIDQLKQAILNATDEETRELMEKQLSDMEKEYREQIENVTQDWEDCMRGIQDAYLDNVKVILEDWENQMAGLADSADMLKLSFDMATDLDDNYLDDYDKLYELGKLMDDIGQSIDDEENLENKEALIELMEEVNDLNESDADISQYTVDILNARYELLKAEAALKDAENAKSIVRMTQDNEGNWGYVYTADQDKVAEAEREYADKLHALEEINQHYIDDLDQKLANLAADASDKIDQIANDSNLTLEEKRDKIQEVYEYTNEMERYLMEQTTLALQDAQQIYDEDAAKYSELTGKKMLDDEKWVNSFEEMKISQITGIQELEAWDDTFANNWDNTIENVTNVTDEFVEKNKEAFAVVEQDIDNAAEEMGKDLNDIALNTQEVTSSIEELADTAQETIQKTVEFADNWAQSWSEAITTIINQNELLAESCGTLISTLADAQAAAMQVEEYSQIEWNDNGGTGSRGSGNGSGSGTGTGTGTANNTSSTGTNNATDTSKDKFLLTYLQGDYAVQVWQRPDGTTYEKKIKVDDAAKKAFLDRQDVKYDTGGYTGTFADTGMYTGEWANGSVRDNGKLAFLHQKELVLNAHDTENFLNAVEIVRKLNETIDLNAMAASKGLGILAPAGVEKEAAQTIEQSVSIQASFPAVKDRNEIEEAFNNLVNKASQFANRKR